MRIWWWLEILVRFHMIFWRSPTKPKCHEKRNVVLILLRNHFSKQKSRWLANVEKKVWKSFWSCTVSQKRTHRQSFFFRIHKRPWYITECNPLLKDWKKSCVSFTLLASLLLWSSFKYRYQFVIHDQDQGTTDGPKDIGEVALEEGLGAFVLEDLDPTIRGSLVHLLTLTAHHHKPPSNGIKWISGSNAAHSNALGNGKLCEQAWFLHHLLGCVVGAKVHGSVNNNT